MGHIALKNTYPYVYCVYTAPFQTHVSVPAPGLPWGGLKIGGCGAAAPMRVDQAATRSMTGRPQCRGPIASTNRCAAAPCRALSGSEITPI